MHQPERKYQLFPKDKQPAASSGKSLDPEQAFALAMGQNGEKGDKPTTGTGLRIRIKEHNLIRRRKVSVPELGPMTTVQEVAMDSPTIPGRPPLHERSISAPGSTWKQSHLAECMTLSRDDAFDERAEIAAAKQTNGESQCQQEQTRQPLSPKSLTPLVIPTLSSTIPRLTRQMSLSRLRSGSTPVESALRSARTDDSPRLRTPYTPLSACLTTPRSAATSTMTTSTLPTPVSAPIECRSSPKPWERTTNYALVSTPPKETILKESVFEGSPTPKAEPAEPPHSASASIHRRNQSDTGSIMERGRPRRRNDNGGPILKRSGSKRSKSAERQAFEMLPKGWKASDAVNMLSPTEVKSIQKQAIQQAARFEVLRKEDVDNLSRELRQLDERTDYLRRTYTSLRAGRRNLHTRICQYLRSPRTAKFSHDSMLKQEEALAELDASIDDWVNKLEQAENRRTRVRQKLLEHVAAAVTLSSPTAGVAGVSETLQLAMGVRPPTSCNGTGNISTPPRSPNKAFFAPNAQSSPSPQRVVAHVPSTIIERPLSEDAASSSPITSTKEDIVKNDALKEEAAKGGVSKEETSTTLRRAETIRVYVDDDVYALMADVENAITKMSAGDFSTPKEGSLYEVERNQLHRAHSDEVLKTYANKALPPVLLPLTNDEKLSFTTALPVSSPAGSEVSGGEVFLTSAVFRPSPPTRSKTGL
ncbi:Up-regulated during septation-domain-containing protein [Bombardia bombarda]|uniref:Up-regulated during septation-domain-containing protein n=1 Tax=Bombardia bombarda TaxID=252184 RepID=A0AA39XKP4_9PEZI|nr:Up-regulated during septation-domain-containing protein [Bombardia bombarda]